MEIIRPNMQKNFLIARVWVNKEKLFTSNLINRTYAQIYVPMGYSLYYTIDNVFNNVFNNLSDKNQMVSSEEIIGKLGKKGCTTLYWVVKDRRLVVPWGVFDEDKNKGYYGSVVFGITDACINKFVTNYICSYEEETENNTGLRFEYLVEYFVRENNKQCGLSIALRDILLPYLVDCNDKTEIRKVIESNDLRDCFADMGLNIDKSTIIVKEKNQESKSENSDGEDK